MLVWGICIERDNSAKFTSDVARAASNSKKRGIWVSPSMFANSRMSRCKIVAT